MVFYNRYYIHESLLVFFTLGFIGAAWRYAQSRKAGWALLAGVFLGLMHATKETFVFSCAAMLTAWIGVMVWNRRGNRGTQYRIPLPPPLVLLTAAAVAVIVSVVLFSSFFTNWHGVWDSVATYFTWSNAPRERRCTTTPGISIWRGCSGTKRKAGLSGPKA